MSITLQLYEDTGPAVSGRGTYRSAVDNIGWKADGTDDNGNHYAFSPIVRPFEDDTLWSRSYKKYHFLAIGGTYPIASRVRIKISNGVNGAPPSEYASETSLTADPTLRQVRIFYKLSNIYDQPNDEWDGELSFLESDELTLYPSVSTTGPEGTQSYPQYLTGSTAYYTQYLITQLEVPYGFNTGNIGEINIEWFCDEYEDGDV